VDGEKVRQTQLAWTRKYIAAARDWAKESVMKTKEHRMQLVHTFASGAEEWKCPSCDHRLIVQWYPEYQKIVLEIGNECVIHNTSKGALVVQCPEQPETELNPWLEWMDRVDFEQLWNSSENYPEFPESIE